MKKEDFEDFIKRLKHWNQGEGVREHITANPVFIVEKKVRDYGYDPDCGCDTVITDSGRELEFDCWESFYDDLDEDEKSQLDDIEPDFLSLSFDSDKIEAAEKLGYEFVVTGIQDRWEYVNCHFTKEAAEAFIARKGYDYRRGLRVFVDSQYWCWEFKDIIEALLNDQLVLKEKEDAV